jgi:hypothetical protein
MFIKMREPAGTAMVARAGADRNGPVAMKAIVKLHSTTKRKHERFIVIPPVV